MTAPLLSVEALSVRAGPHAVLDGVSLTVHAGECVGIVGESGSGKTTLALALMGLLPSALQATGRAVFEGRDLLALSEAARRDLRGRRLSMVFQEPLSALNPRQRIGEQVAEVAMAHGERNARRALGAAIAMLGRVGLSAPEQRALRFPHELSGGERQRVLIAMALLLEPALLIADEPTTALDVTVQAQLIALLRALGRERRLGMLLVTHDLGVVAEMCDRLVVVQHGIVVESGSVAEVFAAPRHPCTAALLAATQQLAIGGRP